MASEKEDLAESSSSSPAASTIQVSRAARPGASENLRAEDSNSEVHSIEESISSASHTQAEQAGSHSAERGQHNSPGHQRRKSYSRSCDGSRGGSCGGSRGGSRGRAQVKSRSRYPRRHHDGRARVQQAQSYNHSSSRRRQQSRARSTARDKHQRTERHARALSGRRKRRRQEYQVSFIEPRAVRSRSRQRSRRSSSQTLREYLREMERDEGRALRHDCYIRASSGRSRRQQRGRRLSYRERQVTRSRTPGRLRSTLPLKDNPRRTECYERQIEQGIHASPRRSERLQQGHQVSLIEPQVSRSQSRGRSRSTQHQTLRENLRRMERDILTSTELSQRHQRRRQTGFTESQVAKK